jgi:hypothetical protein
MGGSTEWEGFKTQSSNPANDPGVAQDTERIAAKVEAVADKIVETEAEYVQQVFSSYRPIEILKREGYCTGYDAQSKLIQIEPDIWVGIDTFAPGTRWWLDWGRPNLGRAEVFGYRIEISRTRKKIPGLEHIIGLYELTPWLLLKIVP